jgi:hypothetical protein
MTEFEAKLERFETLAAECDLISKLTADAAKRELYLRLGQHYHELADYMRTVIATKDAAWTAGSAQQAGLAARPSGTGVTRWLVDKSFRSQ